MQRLAAEIGLSETAFVLEDAGRLRIFTPRIEMPLAGHPVVGAALELARRGRIPSEGRTVFSTGVGETPVELSGGVATMTQDEPRLGPELDPVEVAALLGVGASALARAPSVCGTGIRFVLAELRERATLAALTPDQAGIGAIGDPALGLVAWCRVDDSAVAQRMFAPRMGIREDPATGSAAGALGALRVFQGVEPGPLLVRQGEELGRPSEITVDVGGSAGSPSEVRVGGRAVLVMEGRLEPAVVKPQP